MPYKVRLSLLLVVYLITIPSCGGPVSSTVSPTSTPGQTSDPVAVTITLSLEPPTLHDDGGLPDKSDGTPIVNGEIAGYKIYYGLTSGNYTNNVDVGNVTSIEQTLYLEKGHTYYFAATAYYTTGAETGYSNEQTKDVN